MKKYILPLLFSATACAQSIPKQGLFLGLGGSYNSLHLSEDITGFADSNVYIGGVLVATGSAGGPATTIVSTESTFAPNGQIGYYGHFRNSNWFGGAKFFYEYLGTTITNAPVDLPQNGEFTTVSGTNTFVGNAVIDSAQTTLNHEMGLMAMFGRSFKNSFIYLAAGPSLFGITTELLNGTGYADMNGVHTDITGATISFSDSQWILGGVAQLGVTYFIDHSWFIDINYTYAFTGNFSNTDNAEFTNTSTSSGTSYVTTGILTVETNQKVMTQSLGFMINKRF